MNENNFSFNYGGKSFNSIESKINREENGKVTTVEYLLPDGLKITRIETRYPEYDAFEYLTLFENTSDEPSDIISELFDSDSDLPLGGGREYKFTAYIPDKEHATRIYSPKGSTWEADEFFCDVDVYAHNSYQNHIYVGQTKEYKNVGGRSSEGKAPFFDIYTKDGGIIVAVGWSGQWNCKITRDFDFVNVKTGIENTHFRLLPHEKIRTSSVVIMNYSGERIHGHNKWRRLVKNYFSLIGSEGRPDTVPVCAGFWGGMADKDVLKRLDIIKENKIPFECVWMDAGWYGGESVGESPDEFEGDWGVHTGDWRVNAAHPNGLVDVAERIHSDGLKFLLWFEPERVIKGTPESVEHPEYFIKLENDNNLLLNLGDEKAWKYCFDMLCEKIEALGLDCMRQDFNFRPLPYWRSADAEDRQGITEIKYITGLYRLWDALLEKFPSLIIDNCASGGNRIDIETLRRSVPLWRSDMACPANYFAEYNQLHNASFGSWIPYSGTSTGRIYGAYQCRSAYAGALTTNYTFSSRDDFGSDPEKLKSLKAAVCEYKKVREYFYSDIYPLSEITAANDIWFAVQYNRPENDDGILQVFKRESSCGVTYCYKLYGLCADKKYLFTDADGGEGVVIDGKTLTECGFEVTIKERRSAKIYFYKAI